MLTDFSSKLVQFLARDEVLRGHQKELLHCSANDLALGNWGGVFCEPTGVGKTTVMGAEVKAFDCDSLILVPKRNIADNTKKEFIENLGIPESDIGVYHGDIEWAERQKAAGKKILITTAESLREMIKRGAVDVNRFKYVAIDEAHKFRGAYTRALLERYILHGQDIVVRAYTATDLFMDGSTVGQMLFKRGDYIHKTSLKEAIEKGYLCGVQNIILHSEIIYEGNNHSLELTEREIQSLASRSGRDDKAIAYFANYVHPESGIVLREKQSVWYATSINHANKIAEKLNSIFGPGYAVAISGKSPNRKDILEAHAAGKFKAIVNADLLIEGWNNPACVTCVMLRDTVSPIVATQPPGRVMRIDPNDPFKLAFVINIMDIGRPYSLTFADIVGQTYKLPAGFKFNDRPREKKEVENVRKLFDLENVKAVLTDEEYHKFEKYRAEILDQLEHLKELGVTLTNEEFSQYLKERDAEKQKLGLTPKTDEWLNKNEFASSMLVSINNANLINFWNDLKDGKINWEPAIRTGLFTVKKEKNMQVFCVHKDEVERIREKLQLATIEWNPSWLSKDNFAERINVAPTNPAFVKFWDDVCNERLLWVPALSSGYKNSQKGIDGKLYFVNESEISRVKQHLGIKDVEIRGLRPAEYLGRVEFCKALNLSTKVPVLNKFWEDAEKGLVKMEPPLDAAYFDCKPKITFCIHGKEVDRVREYCGLPKQKTDEWKGKLEVAQQLGTFNAKPAFKSLWQEIEEGILALKTEFLQSGSRTYLFVHESEVPKAAKRYAEILQQPVKPLDKILNERAETESGAPRKAAGRGR